MKPEAFVLALGGIGWLIDAYLLFPQNPKMALLFCIPLAVVCFFFGRRA